MIEEGLTQSRRGTEGGGDRGSAVLRGFVSSCESICRGDEFTLFIDGVYKFGRSGSIGWNDPGAFSITGSGTHPIRWQVMRVEHKAPGVVVDVKPKWY